MALEPLAVEPHEIGVEQQYLEPTAAEQQRTHGVGLVQGGSGSEPTAGVLERVEDVMDMDTHARSQNREHLIEQELDI